MMVHELHDVKYSESKVLIRGEVAVKIFKPSNEEDRGRMNGTCFWYLSASHSNVMGNMMIIQFGDTSFSGNPIF